MSTNGELRKDQHEANVRISARWIAILNNCTFQGKDALDVGNLLGFLLQQHDHAVKEFEAAKVSHPEWSETQSVATQ